MPQRSSRQSVAAHERSLNSLHVHHEHSSGEICLYSTPNQRSKQGGGLPKQLQVKPIWSSGKFRTTIEPTFALLSEAAVRFTGAHDIFLGIQILCKPHSVASRYNMMSNPWKTFLTLMHSCPSRGTRTRFGRPSRTATISPTVEPSPSY